MGFSENHKKINLQDLEYENIALMKSLMKKFIETGEITKESLIWLLAKKSDVYLQQNFKTSHNQIIENGLDNP